VGDKDGRSRENGMFFQNDVYVVDYINTYIRLGTFTSRPVYQCMAGYTMFSFIKDSI
jgi:hypothetical protein